MTTIEFRCEDCGAFSHGDADRLNQVERTYGVLLCVVCRKRTG